MIRKIPPRHGMLKKTLTDWTTEVLDGNRDSVELKRARELRPIVDTVDFLQDIHSMQTVTPP